MKKEKSDIDFVEELCSIVKKLFNLADPKKLSIRGRLHLLINSAKRTGYEHELEKISKEIRKTFMSRDHQL
jgi:hypothetical protein